MSLNKTSPEIVELIEKINAARGNDPAKQLDYSMELLELVEQDGNEDLKDYAYCSLGEACVQNHDFTQGMFYLTQGIRGLAKTDEYELICRCYNEMGIILHNQSHHISSEEAFINCINMARERRLYRFEVAACNNLAGLCAELGDFEDALQYRQRAVEALDFLPSSEEKEYFLFDIVCYIVRLYTLLEDVENSKAAYAELQKVREEIHAEEAGFEGYIADLSYFSFIGDEVNEQKAKEGAIKTYFDCSDFVTYREESLALFKYLMAKKEYGVLEEMFNYFERICVDEELINQFIKIAEYRVKMYRDLGREEDMLRSAYTLFELNEKRRTDGEKTFKTMINLQTEVVQQRVKNLFLSAQAETDALTGLPNRSKLNIVIDELFMLASKESKKLGVEMMDLDFFKLVNDTYGHKTGDELLIRFAGALSGLRNDKVFVARYGGDEFIIYYYDMEDDEILEYVKRIQEEVESIKKVMGLEKLSVSQGIVNSLPHPLNRAWDYMMAADEALYFVKENGKANARIIHTIRELESQYWDKVF